MPGRPRTPGLSWDVLIMCKWGNTKSVYLKIPAHLSFTGHPRWKDAEVDYCIATIVDALQRSGIDMLGCCCGHGKLNGEIHLADGRVLVIKEAGDVKA